PDKELTPRAQEILDLSRMAAKLKLRGSLDVTICNFTVTAQAEDSAPDWQTEVEVTPHITGPNFDHTFRSTVLWPSLASGASVFTEAYADPFFFKEPGRYAMDLDVKVTAQDKNLQGESVYRRVQGAAILGEGGTWQNVEMTETTAQADVARIRDAISSNQLPLAKQIDHPLREKSFPNLPLRSADGMVAQIADAKFFASKEFTIIKASFVGCPPCVLAEPRMETLSEYPGIQALTLVAQTARDVELQKIAPRYLVELKGREYSHPWFIIDSNALAALSVEGFPTYFIVDNRGKVLDTRAGGAITPEYVRGLSRDQARK
ncbi:MAG: hypothetical protein J0M12_04120, partial [Deltaproteobacteria bacterium]|nr:hypothetical protein [Deltaproteobacteria bacterium]